MPLVFIGQLREERDFWEQDSKKWTLRCIEYMKECQELRTVLYQYTQLGSIDYLRKLVEDDKKKKNHLDK